LHNQHDPVRAISFSRKVEDGRVSGSIQCL
jgi:hypothetical protein